jgi:uncharacterized protein
VPVLFCSLEIYLPACHSLKDKRRVVRGASERLRTKFKCSVAELDHQDLWQRSRLGIAVAGSNRAFLEMVSEKIRLESERLLGGDLVDFSAELLEHE